MYMHVRRKGATVKIDLMTKRTNIRRIKLFTLSSKQQLQHWLVSLASSHPPLLSVCLWLCTRKSCYCLPLRAACICLLSVETKETDHKAYCGARSGVHAVCACSYGGLTHTHTHKHFPPPSPHVMPVTWFPGKQLSKSESDFYF